LTKVIDASCVAGIVTAESLPVNADILSLGLRSSTGALLLDEDKAVYITSNAEDVKDLISMMKDITDKLIEISTGLDAAALVTGTQVANIAALTALSVQLGAMELNIK
jgi:hypothetical protein